MINSFQLTLLSNVKSNYRNKPADFESTLAHPLELEGDWEAALIDVSYPEEWNHTGQKLVFAAALINNTKHEPISGEHTMLEDTLENVLIHAYPLSYFKIRLFEIYTGDYQLFSEFLKAIQSMLQNSIHADIELSYTKLTKTFRLSCKQQQIGLAAPRKDSLFDLLGISNNNRIERIERSVQVLVCDNDGIIIGHVPMWKTPDSSICVHCDSIQLTPVDTRVLPLLARIPCKSGTDYWHSSPPYYVRLTSHYLEHLRIWFTTESGVQMPETNEHVVVCVLNFRRRL